MPRTSLAAQIAALTAQVAALTAAPAAPVKAATVTLSALRAAGTFSCGVKGHGKSDDGNFATIGGATFHAVKCSAMAARLAK